MNYKFILKNLENNETIEYKSLRDISKELNIDYFQIRELIENSIKPKKFMHSPHRLFATKYKIITNPNL
jgi:hypothetical protein